MQSVGSMPSHIRYDRVPEPARGGVCLGLLFRKAMFCICHHFWALTHRWQ